MGELAKRHWNPGDPKIGVTILSYYRPEMTKACLENLYLQTQLPFEVLVVDNGSDEQTQKVLTDLHEQGLCHLLLFNGNAGWTVAKNKGLEWLWEHEFDWSVVLENDGVPVVTDRRYNCWLRLCLDALQLSHLPLLQLRHSLRGEPDPDANDLIRVNRFGFRWHFHQEVWAKGLIFPRETLAAIGAFHWGYMRDPSGAYADVDWGSRVLRWSESETGLPLAAALDEKHFRYERLEGSTYPEQETQRASANSAKRGPNEALFRARQKWIGDDPDPDLYEPLTPFTAEPAPDE